MQNPLHFNTLKEALTFVNNQIKKYPSDTAYYQTDEYKQQVFHELYRLCNGNKKT